MPCLRGSLSTWIRVWRRHLLLSLPSLSPKGEWASGTFWSKTTPRVPTLPPHPTARLKSSISQLPHSPLKQMENGIVSWIINVFPLTSSSHLAPLPFLGWSQGRAEAGTGTEKVFGFRGMVQGGLWNSFSMFGHCVVLVFTSIGLL